MATKSTRRKGNVIQVDFTGVESGGGRILPEGPILLELQDISQEKGQDSGEPYLAFTFAVAEGKYEGAKVWDNFSLQNKALWKLRGFLEATRVEINGGLQDIDLDELIGTVVTAEIAHETYQGKKKNRVTGYVNDDADVNDDTDEEEEEEAEEETPKKKTVKKAAAEEEEEEEQKPRKRGRPVGSGKKKVEEEEEPAAEEEEDEPAFKVKQKVKFKDGKKTLFGTVTAIDGDTVTVKSGSDEYEMETDDLEAA